MLERLDLIRRMQLTLDNRLPYAELWQLLSVRVSVIHEHETRPAATAISCRHGKGA